MNNYYNYTIYKITSMNKQNRYVLSLKYDDETIIYYLIDFSNKLPRVERITNTLALLSDNQYTIERIDTNNPEYQYLLDIIKNYRSNNKYRNSLYTTPLTDSDIKILSK